MRINLLKPLLLIIGSLQATGIQALGAEDIDSAWRLPKGAQTLLRLDLLPVLPEGVQVHHLSSYDRTGGNDDGFRGTWSSLYEQDGEHVIMEARGPGCIYTLWFTGPEGGWSRLPWGRLRFYFGDEKQPRIDVDANDFFAGKDLRFPRPLVADPFVSSGGYVSYVPIEFRDGIRVTTEQRCGFYNVLWRTYTDSEFLDNGWPTGERLADLVALFRNRGSWRSIARPVSQIDATYQTGKFDFPPGQAVELARLAGPGTINEIRIDPLFPPTAEDLFEIRIRAWWDSDREPAVDVPLGMFFGSGLTETHVTSAFLGMTSTGHWYNALPMPFWRNARIEIFNGTDHPVEMLAEIDSDSRTWPHTTTGQLHARYRREWPTVEGKDYVIAEAIGRGTFAGYVLAIHPLEPRNKRWWEGDGRMWIDGLRTPVLQGTGHEDEHLGGWSNEFLMRPFSLPFHGEPAVGPLTDVAGQFNGEASLYRFFLPFPFRSEFRHGCEHGIGNRENYRYSSGGFFYLAGEPDLDLADSLVLGNRESETAHSFHAEGDAPAFLLESTFEGREGDSPVRVQGRTLSRAFEFALVVKGDQKGVLLRACFDQQEGNQAFDVYVDGLLAAKGFRAGGNPHRRLREEDIEIPSALVREKTRLQIRIVPIQGTLREISWTAFTWRR